MPFVNTKNEEGKENENDLSDNENEEENTQDEGGEEAASFLETLGVEASQFPHLNLSRTRV